MMPTPNTHCGTFEYRGRLYPEYLKHGNACQFIAPTALQYCRGIGVDIGAGKWPLPGAVPIDARNGQEAASFDFCDLDYVFSSHCLEHLVDPVAALEHWERALKPGGVLFLYLPHPEMEYWQPQHCRKHLHSWAPAEMARLLADLGFINVMHGERDLAWGFAVVGFKP
jgi:SAM-dependent methyltransferase